jgi:hypothetical protein
MADLNRRDFLYAFSAYGTKLGSSPERIRPAPAPTTIKPISGSWFEFQIIPPLRESTGILLVRLSHVNNGTPRSKRSRTSDWSIWYLCVRR